MESLCRPSDRSRQPESLDIPGFAEPFSLTLPPAVQVLRDKALAGQHQPQPGLPDVTLLDAKAWAAHTPEEDWLVWRARRCAERLRAMPVELEPGERIVGKPLFRHPTEDEREALEAARQILASMPPFPGGDAGHFHPDYDKLFRVGIGGILAEIDRRAAAPTVSAEQATCYAACRLALEGMTAFALRVGDECERMATRDNDRSLSWRQLAGICRRVATAPPATFHEALQLMFLTEIALWFGEDHPLTCPGRMDQTLRPFYEADLAHGRTTPREAFELICCLFIQLNRILWPGSAIAVMVGGRDRNGADVTNDLTYLCLAARQATRLVYPTVGLAWHEDTPAELVDFATRLLGTGLGDPAFFNDTLISQGLRDHGVSEPDSHNYMNSTCVEIKVCGASHMWVTAPYFNCPQAVLNVLHDVATNGTPEPETFAAFQELVREDLAATIGQAARRLDAVWKERAVRGCFPLASCFIADCLERGADFDRGGARYNWVENSFVGLANLVDSLTTIRELVYERRRLSLAELHRILTDDFAGHECLRQRILNALPHYGNDDDRADDLAREWSEFLVRATRENTVGLHEYVPGFFCWVVHERMGSQTGATPDGRHAGWALADGAGGAQGREKRGPTASVLSTTKWSHRPALGGLVHNAKFSPSLLQHDKSRRALRSLIETYMRRGGFEIQINVVGKERLLEAQRHPERYQDLLVRVAGYSDYFVHLNPAMQAEIIARTEHEL